MVRLGQLVLSLLAPLVPWLDETSGSDHVSLSGHRQNVTKSIAIVGAGSAGLTILKALLDLPTDVRQGWDIVLFESRMDVGGIWLADSNQPPPPPELPETPLYPRLRTNSPSPTMTWPDFPFPPGTPLFPSHEHIQNYHRLYVKHYNLMPYIRLNHTLDAANWVGPPDNGTWNLTVRVEHEGTQLYHHVDHLIIGTGHNHYPHTPTYPGSPDWLKGGANGKRELLHALYYRKPERYANRTVLVVGSGPSAFDIAQQVVLFAQTTYQSIQDGKERNYPGGEVVRVPLVKSFNRMSITFEDDSSLDDVDTVIFATGYELLYPFLSEPESSSLVVRPRSLDYHQNSSAARHLTTNLRYLYPLHEHIFSLSAEHPPTALSFIGLPVGIAICPSDRAQALLVAHAIADPSLLDSRDEMLSELMEREAELRAVGADPYYVGHRLNIWNDMGHEYNDRLVEFLRARGKMPPGSPFTEAWRRWSTELPRQWLLRRAWFRVESMGDEEMYRWVGKARTEDDWIDVMVRLSAWQEEWERENDIEPAPVDPTLKVWFDY